MVYGIDKKVFDTQVCSLSRLNFLSYGLIKNIDDFEIFDYKEYLQSQIRDIEKEIL
jgi:hypothetical protein